MLNELFSSGWLNVTYAIVMLISFGFALLTLIGGEVGDAFEFDFDTDIEVEGELDFIAISPFALAMFGATFGLVGLITRFGMGMGAFGSLAWATALGFVIGAAAQVLFIAVLSKSNSSHFSLDDNNSQEAQVIVSIPATGMGEVVFINQSGRVKLGARSVTGESIQTGETVIIEKVVGRTAHVRSIDDMGLHLFPKSMGDNYLESNNG